MKRKNDAVFRLAFCAICAGVSVAVLWLGAATGLFDLTALLFAGTVTAVMQVEAGDRFAAVSVAAAFTLAIIFLPEKFLAFGYLALSGVYPLVTRFLPRRGPLLWITRALIGAALTAAYFVLIKFVFTAAYDPAEQYLYPFLAIAGVALFVVYDRWLNVFRRVYLTRLRPRFRK